MPKWLLELGAILIGTETELILKSRFISPDILKENNFNWSYARVNKAIEEIN